MNRCVITLPTLTLAQKARSILMQERIPASVERLSPAHAERGCGWGVTLDCALASRALSLLDRAGLPYRKLESYR